MFLDSLQLQNACFIATVSKGYYPIGMQACCVIEIAPGSRSIGSPTSR